MNILKYYTRLQSTLLGIVVVFGLLTNLQFSLPVSAQTVPAPIEPACQTSSSTPTFNGYTPLALRQDSPDIVSGGCKDMPLLGFDGINKTLSNPREATIIQGQSLNLRIYYNNSATPGSASIANPNLRIQLVRVSDTQFRVTGSLSGSNVATLNSNSAAGGGDLIINTPAGTVFDIVDQSTLHYPDAIERKYVAENNPANRVAPYNAAPWTDYVTIYDRVPDNGNIINTSNPIWTAFDGKTLPSANGYTLKPGGLEAGYLGYGYILTSIVAKQADAAILPPQLPGQEITIVRGQSGSFNPLNPTDGNTPALNPITLTSPNFASRNPSGTPFCVDAAQMAAGYTINCQTDATTPVRSVFQIIPRNSGNVSGPAANFIVNVIEPRIDAIKECFQRGTQTPCSSTTLRPGDQVTYRITVSSTGTSPALNVTLTDTYDRLRLRNITAISDSGVLNEPAGTILWTLGNMAINTSRTVTFEATIANNVQNGDIIVNTVVARSTGLPDITRNVQFPVSIGALTASKECFLINTNTPCSSSVLRPGDQVTYRVNVNNPSNVLVQNVRVVDTYDRVRLTNITSISNSGTNDANAGTITWSLGDLAAGATRSVTFNATVSQAAVNGDIIVNVAVISATGQPDIRVQVDFPIGIGVPIITTSDKICVKKDNNLPCGNTTLRPGDVVIYTVNARNTGTAVGRNLTIVDTYDRVRLINIGNINPQGVLDLAAGTITWTLGDINPGQTVSVRFEATISNSALNGDIIINNAVIRVDTLPDQNVRVQFPIALAFTQVTRSGGLEIFALIAGSALLGFGIYYFYKNPKLATSFIPKRNTEESEAKKK